MTKNEKKVKDMNKKSFTQIKSLTNKDFKEFNEKCYIMSIFEKLLDIADYCPVKLTNDLTQAFFLLQEKNAEENYISTLAVFNHLLLVVHSNKDFIEEKFSAMYKNYQKFEAIKNGK